jgi:hypothetical protein
MRTLLVVLLQVVLAVVVAGALMPLLLFTVPATRSAGPAVLAAVVGLLFVALRLLWPAPRTR